MDIRKNENTGNKNAPKPAIAPNSPEWLQEMRDKLGPFKTGQVLQKQGEGYKTVGPKVPEPVKYDDLPPEKKKAIEDAQKKELEKPNPGLPADMQFNTSITDFLNEEKKAAALEAEEEVKKSESSMPGTGSGIEQPFCQHCGWDLKKQDPGQLEELDKLGFLQSVLGQIPFYKSYDLLGGRLTVTFRTLTSEESDMAFTQIAWDAGRGEILDEGQYFRTLADYRMAMGLSAIRTVDGVVHNLPDSMDKWETDAVQPKATKLVHIVPWIYKNVLKSESVRRAVATCFYRFQRMVEHMEAHFDDPNFWQAIEKLP